MAWRINAWDDFPVHQGPLPVDRPLNSDRHFNDGYWFGFYTDGLYAFCGMRLHPNNNVRTSADATTAMPIIFKLSRELISPRKNISYSWIAKTSAITAAITIRNLSLFMASSRGDRLIEA